ncbi:MAG TPA: CBS domain-containing protein [Myxococcales bacterium]|nr:CBS domain-containing protein [Myxococcales bacterium]
MDDSLVGRLQVRSRQVVLAGGASVAELTVYCPFRQRSLRLEECEECAAYDGTAEGTGGEPIAIACTRLSPAAQVPQVAETVAQGALERTPVSRIMARHVICVQGDMTLRDLAAILVRRRISGMPVVDDEFRPLGIVSKSDLIRYSVEEGRGDAAETDDIGDAGGCVARVMTPAVATLGERASVLEAAAIMAEQRIHRLPIVGRDGRIVGVVSSLDVLAWISRDLPQGEGVATPPG